MVPPWAPNPIPPAGPPEPAPPTPEADATPPANVPMAPAGRFGAARLNLGSFAASGSQKDMRRGVGHYARKGMGGGRTAAARMGSTARTAGALYGALTGLANNQTGALGTGVDSSTLTGKSVDQIITAIIERVRPVDGTQDAEADRSALQGALSSELLEQFPDADLLELTEDQRLFIVERFTALDIFNQLMLNIGKAIQDNIPSISSQIARLKELKNYIKQTVAAEFREARKAGGALNPRTVAGIVRKTIDRSFEVFGDTEE